MKTSFFLFDVDQGQCAALRLPDNRWCLFDAGCSSSFSPIEWIADEVSEEEFHFYKVTISHPHGDHLSDITNLIKHSPCFLRSVNENESYIEACLKTCSSPDSEGILNDYLDFKTKYVSKSTPSYDPAEIKELSLPLLTVGEICGSDNSKVNNASIVTRITCFGKSILLCGDLETDGWDYALSKQNPSFKNWIKLVSNVTVLVAPHHGHKSGYSAELMKLADPEIVIVSTNQNDDNVDCRYSKVPRGIRFEEDGETRKMLSTRTDGHIQIDMYSPPNAHCEIIRNHQLF